MQIGELKDVTRITVVMPEGLVFEKYNAFPSGVVLHLQDDGHTLKVFPRPVDEDD